MKHRKKLLAWLLIFALVLGMLPSLPIGAAAAETEESEAAPVTAEEALTQEEKAEETPVEEVQADTPAEEAPPEGAQTEVTPVEETPVGKDTVSTEETERIQDVETFTAGTNAVAANESSNITASGTCGENLTWTLNDAGTLMISGTGEMEDYDGFFYNASWYDNRIDIKRVVIASGVASIGKCAFDDCTSLTSVTIPDSVISINQAFSNCTSLTSVTIPDSVISIEGAFYKCSSLTSVTIPDSVITIDGAFRSCSSLTSVTIPDGVTSIGMLTFHDCSSLTSMTIPNGVTSIGERAFEGCSSLTNVTIPDSVTSIEGCAFKDCSSLTSVTIPGGVTSMGESVFESCNSLISVTILDGVTSIGYRAFCGCSSLTNVTIPDSVTSIEGWAFKDCSSLTSVTIPDSVTSIGGSATFFGCCSLINVTIPNGVTSIGTQVFYGCSGLTNVTIPDSVTSIEQLAFYGCNSLTSVTIPDSVTSIETNAFKGCTNLMNITILNPQCTISDDEGTLGASGGIIHAEAGSTAQSYAEKYGYTFHAITEGVCPICNSSGEPSHLEITGLSIDKKHDHFYIFLGDSHVYNMDAPDASLYLDLDSISVIDSNMLTPAGITWTSSDESIFRVISSGTSTDVYVNLRVEGIAEGTATLTATNPDGENISLDVTVVKPNELKFTNIYDTKQYYHAGAFYSAASSLSDCVELFIALENALKEGYPCKAEEDLAHHVDVAPITITAAVSGSDFSFDRNSYQNTYSATYDAIAFTSSVYDILTLFPVDMDSFKPGSTYTVEVTLESESFVTPVMETYSFTVYDAEKQRVAEHIDFISNNTYYKVSKQNIYGSDLLELKSDPEYNWSKITSLDFDNYYEIVLADVFIGMLNVSQAETSILPAVLKDWHGTYETLLGGVTTMVKDSYADILDVSEMKIDKILKVSKYTNARDGIYADDDVYQVVLDMFGNVGNVDQIQSFFAAVDDTKSVFSMVKLTGNLVKDFVVWGNSIAVLNAFAQTDENFKAVCRNIADNIPDSERKMKEAIEDYLNYSRDFAGQFSEIYDSFNRLGKDVALDTFKGIVGKEFKDWVVANIVGWIGKIPISGGTATLSTTAAYASFTTAIGSAATGFSLGVCLSDFICSSADKVTEMSKMIAMSEYAPYIIQTLAHYEQNLFASADNNAVDLFENAFEMHQAAQSYIMAHTVKALEVKADSILQTILGNEDYNALAAEILVQKNAIDTLKCCGGLSDESIVYTTKVIAVKCPVNVYVYNGSGEEIIRIVDDYVELSAAGTTVYTRDREKFIALPANQIYSVKIIATDTGTMDYIVFEFDDQLQIHRAVQETDIHLVDGRIFTGEVAAQLDVDETSYELTYESEIAGDVNGDGKVNGKDSILLAQHLAEWEVSINLDAADVNDDGKVNGKDSILLAQYLAEWDVTLQ